MIRIVAPFLLMKGYAAMTIFVFIIVRERSRLSDPVLINHEMIHMFQQLELLVVLHWILYGLFYLYGRIRGLSHDQAYHAIPFEKESHDNEANLKYLFTRKLYAWIKC